MLPNWPLAQLTQEEVFKAIQEQVSDPSGLSPRVWAVILMVVAVVMILIWWNTRPRSPKQSKTINHSRKLIRQMSRELGLAKVEVKQLRLLADIHRRTTGEQVGNPLTLLLCPSVLTKAVAAADASLDRQVVARMAKRLLSRNP